MTDREIDAAVAEKVMGLAVAKDAMREISIPELARGPNQEFRCDVLPREYVPRYTTDPAADYGVLQFVRDNWSNKDVRDFRDTLKSIWDYRAVGQGVEAVWECNQYMVGDYARAALQAKEESK